MSVAARLAKARHDVTVVERSGVLGGRLRPLAIGDGRWHLSEPSLTVPGSIRDLFRKSGRPLEQVLELEHVAVRRHLFADRRVLDLPIAPRSAQHEALTAHFDEDPWSAFVDDGAELWDIVRKRTLDIALTAGFSRAERAALIGRRSLRRHVNHQFASPELRQLVIDPVVLNGDDPRLVPAAEAMWPYLERTFGRFRPIGGFAALADALVQRLTERRVEMLVHRTATGLTVGSAPTVTLADGEVLDADHVIWCAGPPPGHTPRHLLPRIPAARTLIRLERDPAIPLDVMGHGDPPLHAWSEDGLHWTIAHLLAEDPLTALARVGLDWRDQVVERHDRGPAQLVGNAHWGWQWNGRSTRFDRPHRLSATAHVAGASAHPGGEIELIAAATAAIAAELGTAPR